MLETKKTNKKQLTVRGTSGTRHNKHNPDFKINNEIKLTFVFVYRNDAMFSGNINDCVIIFNNNAA